MESDKIIKSWIIDYYFCKLSRLFKERSSAEFRNTLKIFEALVDELCCPLKSDSPQRTICCFLARVMDGENLDVRYEHVAQITPLMSALPIWESLKDISDLALFDKIHTLLMVQSVAVCVKKGNYKFAKETLQWLEKQTDVPEKLQRKLATIVNKKDTYDQVLMNFSFDHLMENVDTFLDAFNQQHSSIFLLEAASKVVEACHKRSEKTSSEVDRFEETPSSPQSSKSQENMEQMDTLNKNVRPKKKLLSKLNDPWKPETPKKAHTTRRRTTSICKVSRRSVPSEVQANVTVSSQHRRKWSANEDMNLKAGVRKYGVGKWKEILEDFEFNNRNGVNLKDRWRTLTKLYKDC